MGALLVCGFWFYFIYGCFSQHKTWQNGDQEDQRKIRVLQTQGKRNGFDSSAELRQITQVAQVCERK